MKLSKVTRTHLLSSAIILSLLTPVAMADTEIQAVVKAISDLSFAQAQTKAAYTYQEDILLPNHKAAATASQIAMGTTQKRNKNSSEQAISNQLNPMSDAVQAQSSSDKVAITDIDKANEAKDTMADVANQSQDATLYNVAGDSLIVNFIHPTITDPSYQIDGKAADILTSAFKPSLGNKQFDFTTLFETMNYANDPGSEQAADKFVSLLFGSDQSLYSKLLDLGGISQAVRTANVNDPSGATAAQEIRALASSQNFQDIQEKVREAVAAQSIAQSVFTDAVNARKPIIKDNNDNADLNEVATQITGNPDGPTYDSATKQYIYPSEEQMAQYDANHDLSSKEWYQEVATMSEANVARESLIMQKKLLRSQYQQHLEQERIELLLAAAQLQSNNNDLQTSLITQTKAVNDWVSNLDPSADSIGSPDNTQTPGSSS